MNPLFDKIMETLSKMKHVEIKDSKVIPPACIGGQSLSLSEIVVGYSRGVFGPKENLDGIKAYLMQDFGMPNNEKADQLRYDFEAGSVKYAVVVTETPIITKTVQD